MEFMDDNYRLSVDQTGKLANGLINKRYYRNGYLLKAEEGTHYQVVYTFGMDGWSDYALLSESGTVVTQGTVSDAEGSYYVVKDGTIYKADSSLIAPAQTAGAFSRENEMIKVDGAIYRIIVGEFSNGVYPLILILEGQ